MDNRKKWLLFFTVAIALALLTLPDILTVIHYNQGVSQAAPSLQGGCEGCPCGCDQQSGYSCKACGGYDDPTPPSPGDDATPPPGGDDGDATPPPGGDVTPEPPDFCEENPDGYDFTVVCGSTSPFCGATPTDFGPFMARLYYDCATNTYFWGEEAGQWNDECCIPATPAPPPKPTQPPVTCNPPFIFGDGEITYRECGVGFTLEAFAQIPTYKVFYNPYPRGLVFQEMTFGGDAELKEQRFQWSGTVDDWNPGKWEYDPETSEVPPPYGPGGKHQEWRNFKIGIRWRQVNQDTPMTDPPKCWVKWRWDERPWSSAENTTCAEIPAAQHTYIASSAEKSENGPGNLPAYQVEAKTFWVPDWRWEWERYKCVEWTEECRKTNDDHPDCTTDGGEAGRLRKKCIRKDWVGESKSGACDLTAFGESHPWRESGLLLLPDNRVMSALPVPVIEVQGVIRK